jgi:hypothetical protein
LLGRLLCALDGQARLIPVSPKDLVLFRELMLERYGDRFSEENYPTPKNSEE